LSGGEGNDTLIGGTGDDNLSGGAGLDTVSYSSTSGAVAVSLAISSAQNTVGAGTDTLGSTIEHLTGSNYNDTLTGNSAGNRLEGGLGDDTLTGNAGNDTLDGGAGIDVMAGGTGNDLYLINHFSDSVSETAAGGIDTLQSTVTRSLNGIYVEHLTLTGSGNASATGNSLANILMGNSGNNLLRGSTGADTLTGGTGVDRFDYNALGEAGDTITDFTAGAGGDKLDIDQLLTALGYGGVNPITAGYVQVLQSGAHTLVNIDSNGGGDNFATTLATLQNVTAASVTLADNFMV